MDQHGKGGLGAGTKGTSKILIHYPNKQADAYNSVLLEGLRIAWNGLADLDGQGDVVGGIVIMRYGKNAEKVIERIRTKLDELKPSLPKGVEIVTTYDRAELIERAIETLKGTLIEELIIVSLIVMIFLWHIPSAIVPIITIPITIIIAFVPMYLMGLTANIMSLGGIAIAIGAMIDASIVVVEQTHKKLEHWNAEGRHGSYKDVVITAVKEVGGPSFFALGGVAQIEKEATDAKTEFLIGIVGPITSFLIGVICLGIALALGWRPPEFPARPTPMLMWLGYINITLAIFNMVPGFPLDGGRVLRAIIWWITSYAKRATVIAARIGQVIAFGFIVFGVLRFFGGAGFGGLWIAFIGWFLLSASRKNQAQVAITEGLRGVRVADVGTYTTDLGNVVDMEVISGAKLSMGVDPLGGAGVHYWGRIAERYGLNLTVVNESAHRSSVGCVGRVLAEVGYELVTDLDRVMMNT